MTLSNNCKLANLFVLSALSSSPLVIAKDVDSGDLVGKTYIGGHIMHFEADNDRLTTPDPQSYMDDGNGAGVEIGYRWLPSTEFRLSYTKIDFNSAYARFDEPSGSALSVDMLYFPTEKNVYLMAGVNNLEVENSQTSANFGLGYRHYFSEKAAIYLEGKGHYQFSGHYDELSTQLGFIYFFGDKPAPQSKPRPAPQPKPAVIKPTTAAPIQATPVEVKPTVLDDDKDGVLNPKDKCPNTPMTERVDFNGCSIFVNDTSTVKLLINFDNDKAIVKSEYFSEVEKIAGFLAENSDLSITIEGHASSVGSNAYNKRLSQKRADAIVNMLIEKYNIPSSQLTAIGYGEEQLLNPANTKAAHAENRRTMATIDITKEVAVPR